MNKVLEKERPTTKKKTSSSKPETASQLPEPCGYKILIALPEQEEVTAGGVIVPDVIRDPVPCLSGNTHPYSRKRVSFN